MNFLNPNQLNVEEALRSAYRDRRKPVIGSAWESNVMRSVRALRPLNPSLDFSFQLGQWIWRLAPAAAVLILVLSVFLVEMEFSPEYEMTGVYWSEPTDLTALDSFDV